MHNAHNAYWEPDWHWTMWYWNMIYGELALVLIEVWIKHKNWWHFSIPTTTNARSFSCRYIDAGYWYHQIVWHSQVTSHNTWTLYNVYIATPWWATSRFSRLIYLARQRCQKSTINHSPKWLFLSSAETRKTVQRNWFGNKWVGRVCVSSPGSNETNFTCLVDCHMEIWMVRCDDAGCW